MIIIDHEVDLEGTQAGTAKWLDPVIELQTAQFREATCRLEKLRPEDRPEDLVLAEKTAEHLCDASREIVYRMHRVTQKQLNEATAIFERVADLIESWKLARVGKEKRDLIHAYGLHVRKRAQLLRNRLQ